MTAAISVFAAAFNVARDPRSPAYKAGVLACLQRRLDRAPLTPPPFAEGTAHLDAWLSGWCEGMELAMVELTKMVDAEVPA